jgi:hypothetical protein
MIVWFKAFSTALIKCHLKTKERKWSWDLWKDWEAVWNSDLFSLIQLCFISSFTTDWISVFLIAHGNMTSPLLLSAHLLGRWTLSLPLFHIWGGDHPWSAQFRPNQVQSGLIKMSPRKQIPETHFYEKALPREKSSGRNKIGSDSLRCLFFYS